MTNIATLKASREAQRTRSLAMASMHRVALAPPRSPHLARLSNGSQANTKKRSSHNAITQARDALGQTDAASPDERVDSDEGCQEEKGRPVPASARGAIEVNLADLVRDTPASSKGAHEYEIVPVPKQVIALDDRDFAAPGGPLFGVGRGAEEDEDDWEILDVPDKVTYAGVVKNVANVAPIAVKAC